MEFGKTGFLKSETNFNGVGFKNNCKVFFSGVNYIAGFFQ